MDSRACWVVIPARMGSSRFPGKPLALLHGVPMLGHVVSRALQVGAGPVVVATDHSAIADVAAAFGAIPVLTGEARNGTERVAQALDLLGVHPRWVVNIQGDQPLLQPATVTRVIDRLALGAAIATAAAPYLGDPHDLDRVKVAFSATGRAMWFSRSAIPSRGPWWQHIGIYGFTPESLRQAVTAPASTAAPSEDLEQLSWLEAELPIWVERVAEAPPGVDTPGQLAAIAGL